MTFTEIINKIDTSKKPDVWFDFEDLMSEFGLNWCFASSSEHQDRMRGYFLHVWLCTDTWVGSIAWFLDGEFVYFTHKPARKSDTTYKFASEESFDKVQKFVLSALVDDTQPDYLDLDDEAPEKFSVEYSSQILHKYVWYQNELVEVVKSIFPYAQGNKDYFHRVDIKFRGKVISVDVSELLLDWGSPRKTNKQD